MEKTNEKYGAYVQILKEELVPAMGCTEPIAIAYCAAKARSKLTRGLRRPSWRWHGAAQEAHLPNSP